MNVKIKLSDCLRPLLLGALFLGTASAHAAVQPLDKVVAIVDNDVIMQSQLDQRVKEVQQTIAKRGGGVPPTSVLDQQVLERLIVENLQLQIGERSGIRISDEELNQAVGTIAQRNNMSIDQFRAALARDGLSYEDARDQIRREMIISRVRQRRVAERVQVSEQEVKNFLASDLGKMQLSEELHLANILIPTPDSANSEQLNAAAAKTKAIYDRLKAGADFAQMAIAQSGSDNIKHTASRASRYFLLQPGNFQFLQAHHLTTIRGDLSRNDFHQGGFTSAVTANQTNPFTFIELKVDFIK